MGGNKLSIPADKRIVIVGGGYGGATVGSQLLKERHPNFTLIDGREAMHHNVASGRAALQKGFITKTFIPFKPTFQNHFRQAIVSNIQPVERQVVLNDGEAVPYDILILATGTSGPFPVKLEFESMANSIAKYEEMCDKIKAANSVTVVGGGAAGVEFSAEIKSDYPDKTVTMVHSHEKILEYPSVTEAFRDGVRSIMDRIKVVMLLGERVNNLSSLPVNGPGTVETSGGKTLESDLVLRCTGLKTNTGAYNKSPLATVMEPNGTLKVNEYLEVEGHPDVYAIGDCNNTPEVKLAMSAFGQGDFIVENLKKKYNNQAMVAYKPGSLGISMMLALGRDAGLAQTSGGWIIWESIAKKMKAGSMMVDMTWKVFEQKPPN